MKETKEEDGKIWKLFRGKYWVSEYGDFVNASTGHHLKTQVRETGYVRTCYSVIASGSVHRAVYEAFMGEIP